MPTISIYILTYNEAEKIRDAIASALWADEIVVADSHSTDATVAIAESMGARVVQLDFRGFGDLRNQAVAACVGDWIFSLDSDERCTPEVRDEVLALIERPDAEDAYLVPRRNRLMGRWIAHSGWYPNYRQPQLFRRGTLIYRNDLVHEGWVLKNSGSPGYLQAAIWQIPFKDFEQLLHKANRYSTLGAERPSDKRVSMGMALGHGVWSFLKHYLFKLGVLDGWAGFVIALGNFEGTFWRYAKRYEKQEAWQSPAVQTLERPPAARIKNQ